MILYEFGYCRSTRVHWLLREVGVEYESVSVDLCKGEQRSPAFLAVNPYGKLPVLVDGGLTVTESAAICTYLADKYPGSHLIPDPGTAGRAHYYQWTCFCIAELEPQLWSIRKNMLLYPKARRSLQAVRVAREEYDLAVQVLDDHLSKHDYVVGASFGAADVIICYNLIWADTLKLLDAYPALGDYVERLKRRPAFPGHLFSEKYRRLMR